VKAEAAKLQDAGISMGAGKAEQEKTLAHARHRFHTMVLDSSGTCYGERRMAVSNARSARFEVRDRSPMEVADGGLGYFPRLLLPCRRQSGSHRAATSERDVLLRRLVRIGRHSLAAGTTQFRSDWSAYGSIIRAMASLCGTASKNQEMYRTFAL
jgi:hypothetical protein